MLSLDKAVITALDPTLKEFGPEIKRDVSPLTFTSFTTCIVMWVLSFSPKIPTISMLPSARPVIEPVPSAFVTNDTFVSSSAIYSIPVTGTLFLDLLIAVAVIVSVVPIRSCFGPESFKNKILESLLPNSSTIVTSAVADLDLSTTLSALIFTLPELGTAEGAV